MATKSWPYWDDIRLGAALQTPDAAAIERRQSQTAQEILRRLEDQPGVVLADGVGMGKTFVSLAVAASVAKASGLRHPVVVMVPPSLRAKWPQEWATFSSQCLPQGHGLRATDGTITSPTEFMRLFDDDAANRRHIAFVTHGALTRNASDPLTRLAIAKSAFRNVARLKTHRESYIRWSNHLLVPWLKPDLTRVLLRAPLHEWAAILERHLPGREWHDDPVYLGLSSLLTASSLVGLRTALGTLPLRTSANVNAHLSRSKAAINNATQEAWLAALRAADIHSPLLVLDEAHSLRHDGTRMASLFESFEPGEEAELLGGQGAARALAGKFDRMLFLTATPFQLGHKELINVLDRFEAVRWTTARSREKFAEDRRDLAAALDLMQTSALGLDSAWGRLTPEDVSDAPEEWWRATDDQGNAHRLHARNALEAMGTQVHQTQGLLRPWVIRHVRTDGADRRRHVAGDGLRMDGDPSIGLGVPTDALLPFLLAARARTHVANSEGTTTRAFFADGIASSFEAFRDTRDHADAGADREGVTVRTAAGAAPELEWYLDWMRKTLPRGRADVGTLHPKVAATADRAVLEWTRGEKTLIFCFYRETGRALRSAISQRLEAMVVAQAAEYLGMDPSDSAGVFERLATISDNVWRVDSSARTSIADELATMANDFGLVGPEVATLIDVTFGYFGTQTYLVRHLLPNGSGRDAALASFDHPDASGSTPRSRIQQLLERLQPMSEESRRPILEHLDQLRPGRYRTLDKAEGTASTAMILPNVRLANGEVRQETRQMLITAFKLPFYPEILIASPVLAEGVDLHWECRIVIHHDLDWNPSNVEQRNGRLDRIGSRSEQVQHPIEIYEPFITGMQDEKMYRVVKDRERWFSLVMGGRLQLDERTTDAIAARVPLPEEVADELSLDLSVANSI